MLDNFFSLIYSVNQFFVMIYFIFYIEIIRIFKLCQGLKVFRAGCTNTDYLIPVLTHHTTATATVGQ